MMSAGMAARTPRAASVSKPVATSRMMTPIADRAGGASAALSKPGVNRALTAAAHFAPRRAPYPVKNTMRWT